MTEQPQQTQDPVEVSPIDFIAIVKGYEFTELPKDLYIPPQAMEVILELFEGPLDLLLYLIRKHSLDILDIPVAEITKQYVKYVEFLKTANLPLIADYLEMAAILTEIKSRMLLPKPETEDGEEEDPRAELVRRLKEYEFIKEAAVQLDEMPRLERDIFVPHIAVSDQKHIKPDPEVSMNELLRAFKQVLTRVDVEASHKIEREHVSVREKMSHILDALGGGEGFDRFEYFFNVEDGKLGIVVTFLAILELAKNSLIEIVQNEPYAPIYIRTKPHD